MCQAQFQTMGIADCDGDGIGEFGTFGEMTGSCGVRANADGSKRKARLTLPILSPALADVDENGIVVKAGHCFRIYLPGRGGTPVRESKVSPVHSDGLVERPFSGELDPEKAETRWCAYSWPVEAFHTGQRVFYVDQAGDVWQTRNEDRRYSGKGGGPAWDAAMPTDGWSTAWTSLNDADEPGRTARDGNIWKPTN